MPLKVLLSQAAWAVLPRIGTPEARGLPRSPSSALLSPFSVGMVFPTKIDGKKGTLILTSVLEELVASSLENQLQRTTGAVPPGAGWTHKGFWE